MSDLIDSCYRYKTEERPCEPRCCNEDPEMWADICFWEESRGNYYKFKYEQLKASLENLDKTNDIED